MTRARALKSAGWGEMIFAKEVRPSSRPKNSTMKDTITPERYSMRAWPKGCFSSAGLPASLKPTSMTMEEPESVRLFTASAMTATLPDTSPAASLMANSSKLVAMPTAPATLPLFSRTWGVSWAP